MLYSNHWSKEEKTDPITALMTETEKLNNAQSSMNRQAVAGNPCKLML